MVEYIRLHGTDIMGSWVRVPEAGGCNHVTLASSAARIRCSPHEWAPTLPLPFPILGSCSSCYPPPFECTVTGVLSPLFQSILLSNVQPGLDLVSVASFSSYFASWFLLLSQQRNREIFSRRSGDRTSPGFVPGMNLDLLGMN